MQEIKFITEPDTSLLNRYDELVSSSDVDFVTIDWNMGNVCNYSCTYCDDYANDGSVQWKSIDTALEFCRVATIHYKSLGKQLLWNLLGGEPTVWKDFIPFISRLKEYDPDNRIRILTNGSRTLNWWAKASPFLDDIVISYHPESADINHICDVSSILREHGVFHTIQVCLYPLHLDKCREAAEYFYNNSMCNSVIIKTLRKTLGSHEAFKYDNEYLDDILKFDDIPVWSINNLSDDEQKNMFAKRLEFKNNKETVEVTPNELMRTGKNTWKGWKCNIGLETIVITMDGNITSGSSCNHECNHGHIDFPHEILFPVEPTVCKWDWCSCIADIETAKTKR
jgi:organic radical activating enzyme